MLNGSNKVAVMYSRASSFNLGDGNNSIAMGSAVSSSVTVGEGENDITMGVNRGMPAKSGFGADHLLSSTTWQTPSEKNEARAPELEKAWF